MVDRMLKNDGRIGTAREMGRILATADSPRGGRGLSLRQHTHAEQYRTAPDLLQKMCRLEIDVHVRRKAFG